jgi:SAM-dependent methyltransferase
MSRFGVMFFESPGAAFENIRRQLKPGGRLVFACWQGEAENPWFTSAILARLRPPAPTAHGGPPPGPMAFGDRDYVTKVLTGAGFREVELTPFAYTWRDQPGSMSDARQLAPLNLSPEDHARAKAELEAHEARFRVGDEVVSERRAFIVSARA